MFARAAAAVGLAAMMTIGMIGTAQAAPADRAGDPVVLTGKDLPSLKGSAPARVAAFKWAGRWQQVPVQIDERHEVRARSLYPEKLTYPTYVSPGTAYGLEVYADVKTRSGADKDRSFDANDELVFMAGDSGPKAPATAPTPAGMIPASATRLKVADPLGGTAWVYLFRSVKKVDQSAGKDYVKYDFKLTNLGAGQNMRDHYGYQDSSNPEDSTVTTDSYQLHSVDRWMEDELRVKAGGASGENILDREAVSGGGLKGCSRSEYTFSGNWDLDIKPGNDRPDDTDEGSYLAVKDGPVRAIRSFVGANSGPFVQKNHFYYGDSEVLTINLRVHPLPDLYVWTDLSDKAVGMTFRDARNKAGVPVDGVRDTLDGFGGADFENGQFVWQQVGGSQGTVTTLTSATDTFHIGAPDWPKPEYTSYYLDASDPNSQEELQCGGDLKAYGAHGFGLKGMVPNTDPALSALGLSNMQVSRVRHFGAPGGGTAEAEAFSQRANQPLTIAEKAGTKVRLKAKVLPGRIPAKAGKSGVVKVRVSNPGLLAAAGVKVCVRTSPNGFKGCAKVKVVRAGGSATVKVKAKVQGKRLRRGKANAFAVVTAKALPKATARGRLEVR